MINVPGARLRLGAALGGLLAPWLVVAPAAAAPGAVPTAAVTCTNLNRPLTDRLNPTTTAQLLTLRAATVKRYAALGFSVDRGQPATASGTSHAGLAAVHRLYRPRYRDFFYTADPAELARAVANLGYRDQGTAYFAARTDAASCLVPMYSFLRKGVHRFSTSPGEQAVLAATGWRSEGIRFYVGAPVHDDVFTLGVIPDTQQEVLRAGDSRFLNRSHWLADQRRRLDLRFATHTGDVVNWDTGDHAQYVRGAAALRPLSAAGIPYSISPGNHDTAAVCAGGSACNTHQTRALVRQTSSFNAYLNGGTAALAGRFEAGKVDNTYSTFSAGRASWLVLNLELWPRAAAVRWARQVVAAHPQHNVVVVTHSYLTAGGRVSASSGYGDSSPQYLYDHLIKVYPNIRVVLSGHVGKEATRVDTGSRGNTIVSLMLTMHDNVTNPLRLVEVNTTAGTLNTWVYAPYTNRAYPKYSKTWSGLSWIR